MTLQGRQQLKNLLTTHEAYKQFPYVDTTGHLTIGIGRNLTNRGVSLSEALQLLNDDIDYFSQKLTSFLKFYDTLNEPRQMVLVDMCFNLGVQGLLNFTHMMLALEATDFERAADEMLNSIWASQVGDRAKMLAQIMRTGVL